MLVFAWIRVAGSYRYAQVLYFKVLSMPADKIKQLEELVSSVLQNLDNFYSENSRLNQRIQVLEKEKAASSKESNRAKDLLEKVKQLETSRRKLKKDGSTVRIKIKNVLKKIDKMDFV